ncbi:uncharacterized protein LOC110882718 [Helianthus annuus]|uniref:uncharacterized protein LOC110882718 n=1 Tax=Helianthus annuus TaxID=4232 RepID=UPI000B8F8AA1|nr:uncharacterized protein LOC110882718 [Helianthus annuus]
MWDKYLMMAGKTSRDALANFSECVIELYGERYLRKPTWKDLQRVYDVHEEQHGLPDMISAIDYMHWLGPIVQRLGMRSILTTGELISKKVQKSAIKDIERVFGVLQQRWRFVRNPCRLWRKDKVRIAMYCFLILHNMILEDEGKVICQDYDPQLVDAGQVGVPMEQRLDNSAFMRSSQAHQALIADLQHAWMRRWDGEENEDE